jgi:integrase
VARHFWQVGRTIEQRSLETQWRYNDRLFELGRCGGCGRTWSLIMSDEIKPKSASSHVPRNKGRLVGQKHPLRQKEVWAIRVRLQIKHGKRDLAMFNFAIDSKLRGCDLGSLRVDDIAVGDHVRERATIVQHKTGRPVQLKITEQTRASLQDWLKARPADRGPYLFPSRAHNQPHVTARQCARIVHGWIEGAGMDSNAYGTHSMRRTKAAQIYRKTGNLRAVQLLLGHMKIESTVRYLGIEVDDALTLSEQVEL